MTQQIENFLANIFQFQTQIHEHLGGDTLLLAQQPQQKMLSSHIVVAEVAGFLQGIVKDFLGTRGVR